MLEARRILRLSLALNIVLVFAAYFSFWHFSGQQPAYEPAGPTDFDALLGHDRGRPHTVKPAGKPKSCGICDAGETGRALCDEWGSDVVARTMAFTDGNTRLQRVLAKWRSGKPVRFAVIGGSNSAGQGVWDDNKMTYSKLNMHVILFNHLNKLFPQHGEAMLEHAPDGDQNSFFNGAQFGKSTEYFVMCSQLHLPEDVDLIAIEFAVNDQYTEDATASYESLMRSLLERPGDPAVIELQTFAYDFERILTGEPGHLATNLYYNIPTVAPRTLFYETAQRNVTKFWDWFYWFNPHERPAEITGVDLRHFGPGGHKVSGDLMSAYIDQQLCEMDALEASTAGTKDIDTLYPAQPIPKLSLLSAFSRDDPGASMPSMHPSCQVIDSDTHPLNIISNKGWEKWTWRNDETGKEKHYLRATTPESKVTFQLPLVTGRVELYYLRSRSFGLGNVKCWLNGGDGGEHQLEIQAYWDQDENIGQITRWRNVPQGEYTMTCEVLHETSDPGGGHEFRIISLMSF